MSADPPDPLPRPLTDDLLDALEDRWRRQGAPLLGGLRPGLTDDQIDELSQPFGLQLPAELRLWWRWHDGVGKPARNWAICGPGWEFIPLSRALERTSKERRWSEAEGTLASPSLAWEDATDPTSWSPRLLVWVPDLHGGRLVVDCGASDSTSKLYYLDKEEWSPEDGAVARSLGEMVAWWIEALDDGAMAFDAGAGRWRYDWDGCQHISNRRKPSKAWPLSHRGISGSQMA